MHKLKLNFKKKRVKCHKENIVKRGRQMRGDINGSKRKRRAAEGRERIRLKESK